MFSDTDVGCVTIALALYSIQEKNRRWIKEWYTRKSQDRLSSEWAKRLQIFFVRFDGPSFDGILKTTIAKETLTCEVQYCQSSLTTLRYLATGNNS